MKLRRAMAVAAATAALAPLALLSAPAAFADTDPPAAAESSPAAQDTTPAAEDTTPAAEDTTPAAEDTTPAAEDTTPAAEDTTPAAGDAAPATGDSTPSGTATPTPSTPEEGDEPDLCVDEDGNDLTEISTDLTSGLAGLPDTIVAGSGWTNFSFNVSNHGDDTITNIAPLIGVAAIGWDEEDYSGEISVQVLDKDSGTWREVAGAAGEGGTFTPFSLDAGQSTSYELRLSVSGHVPDAIGVTGGFAQYSDDEGCWVADDPNGWIYFFDILAAGSDAGSPPDAKPQTGGAKEISDAKTVDASGSLAETGSSSALPLIGLTGGVAVVAGAGAVYVVRRRKSGDAAA
ncbi:LPXTG cell wall anchor domain-containing protein [Streptomyces sp. NPDC060223]|uniref:LPXTG cell wall anchor domain-containing protein n=1 Tax=unclassified Streptomyces TaxID=2593676 RepID=UPI0036264017